MSANEGLLHRAFRRALRLVPPEAFRRVQERFRGRGGLEIGGPSALFERWNLWPVYPLVQSLDNYNLAAKTLWQDHTRTPGIFRYDRGRRTGREFLGEAADMHEIRTDSYDFLLASHVIEHLANPVKALARWAQIVREGGTFLLVIPHRDGTFDRRREVTSLEHLFVDFERDTPETDQTHLEDVLRLHDLSRDPGAGNRDTFEARVRANSDYRSVHHHVFDTELGVRLLSSVGLRTVYLDIQAPHHICIAAEVTAPSKGPRSRSIGPGPIDNTAYLSRNAPWRRLSPFPTDRREGSIDR